MKLIVFILIVALAGLVYKYRQEAEITRLELATANAQLLQLRRTLQGPDPAQLQRQLAAAQQQIAEMARQVDLSRRQLAAPRLQPSGVVVPTFNGTETRGPLHGTALDEPARPAATAAPAKGANAVNAMAPRPY